MGGGGRCSRWGYGWEVCLGGTGGLCGRWGVAVERWGGGGALW